MKTHRVVAIVATAAVVSVLGAFSLFTPSFNSITLPIEVMSGSDGATESVTLQATDGGSASEIYIKAHSISYPSWEEFTEVKASIRVNGGAWVDLTNDVANCLPGTPENEYFECLGGPYPTIRFTVSGNVSGELQDGANTIDFRYNRASADESPDTFGTPSSGFRILDIDLWTSPGNSILDGTSKNFDNPASWQPPAGYDNPSDISAGQDLWSSRSSLIDAPGEHPIVAACADCHAEDGSDLKYFAFSNKSIVARSKWHGLTENQGNQIAAYIRTRVLQDRDTGHTYDYGAYSWTPVYQPGPTAVASRSPGEPRTDGTPIHQMPGDGSQYVSGGAGLAWSLDDDSDTMPYLFPNGVTNEIMDGSLKMWDIPVALQYADWNEWLPVHHPLDMYGDAWVDETAGGPDYHPWSVYYGDASDGPRNYRYQFEQCAGSTGSISVGCLNNARSFANLIYEDTRQWVNRKDGVSTSRLYENVNHHDSFAYRKVNSYKFSSVKTWELELKFDLADEYQRLVPDGDDLQLLSGTGRYVFDQAPHLSGQYAGNEVGRWDLWLDNMWYELNAQHNHGRGYSMGQNPNDWIYQFMHANAFQWLPARYTKSYIKAIQNCEAFDPNVSPFDYGSPDGWHQRQGFCDPNTIILWRDWVVPGLNSYGADAGSALLEASYRFVAEEMMYGDEENNTYNQATGAFAGDVDRNWTRKTGTQGWEPENFTPEYSHGYPRDSQTPSHYLIGYQALTGYNIKASLIDSMAAWSNQMNPDPKWNQWRCSSHTGSLQCPGESLIGDGDDSDGGDGPTDPSAALVITAPEPAASYEEPASFPIRVDTSNIDAIDQVDFYANDFRLGTRYRNFEYIWTHAPAGTYLLHAEALTESGDTILSDSVTITVDSGSSTADPAVQSLSLTEGWNLISVRVAPNTTAMDSFFAPIVDSVELVKDSHANVYIPATIDQIEHWNPLQAYSVYVTESTTLSVSGAPLRPGETPIPLTEGWNLIPFLGETPVPIEVALSSISDVLVMVKDGQGNVYFPQFDGNGIDSLVPGRGYRLFVSDDATLSYPNPETRTLRSTRSSTD